LLITHPVFYFTEGKEANRRARDRAAYTLQNIGRWEKLGAKVIMVEMEHVLGRTINRDMTYAKYLPQLLCKVFSTSI
jgi:hypothetical protein